MPEKKKRPPAFGDRKRPSKNKMKTVQLGAPVTAQVNTVGMSSLFLDGWRYFRGYQFSWIEKNDTIVGFKIRGHCLFFHNSYRKLPFRWY